MIAIIDYDTGNLRSVENALRRLGAEYVLTSDRDVITAADKVLLPGVGEASTSMARLRERGLDSLIPVLRQPVLGICIGMQLMCRHSGEGDVDCMSIFRADVRRMPSGAVSPDGLPVKVPHTGWDRLERLGGALFRDVPEGVYVYFVHSFAAGVCADTSAVCCSGVPFSAALTRDNFYGVQFHPEKSGVAGERIIKNFLLIDR